MFEPLVSTVVSQVDRAVRRVGQRSALPGLVAAALLLAPIALEAQDDTGPEAGTVSVDARGGLAIPIADLDEIAQTGASFGGGVAIHLTRQVALRADAEYQILSGDRTPPPENLLFADMNSLIATGGIEIHFLDPGTRWTGALSLGAGISTFDTDDTTDEGTAAPVSLDDLTNLAFRSGTKLGYQVTDRLDIYLEPAVYLTVFDREDTQLFDAASGNVSAFDVGWTIPVQAGARLRF